MRYRTKKTNDHSDLDSFIADRVYVRSLLLKNQTDLHDDYSIDHHLRFHHLTRVA
jgi:hypothetical protein